jgi:hypothetical protein
MHQVAGSRNSRISGRELLHSTTQPKLAQVAESSNPMIELLDHATLGVSCCVQQLDQIQQGELLGPIENRCELLNLGTQRKLVNLATRASWWTS